MGKQLKQRTKRKNRKRYIKRKKAEVREMILNKSK